MGTKPERKRLYSREEINNILKVTGFEREDFSYLCSISSHLMVLEGSGEVGLGWLKSISVPVIETDEFATGIYFETGSMPLIVINETESILDYDFISELHPNHDVEVYLWLTSPWEVEGEPLSIYGDWYRRDVYKDGFKPFDGNQLGWEDKPHQIEY